MCVLALTTDQRPIGVFDSGLGGLTTVAELSRIMPAENIVYFGDTGRVPYGTRSFETIQRYASQDIAFLISQGVKLIVVACNTASTILTDEMIKALPVPLLEVISPAASAAAKATRNKRIGVIGTSATVKSGTYEKILTKRGCEVFLEACPLFVPLVENGLSDDGNEITAAVARLYLSELSKMDTDVLILGCTHYPIIKMAISEVMGDKVALIDSGKEVAAVAREALASASALNNTKAIGSIKCFVSDSTEGFYESAEQITKGKLHFTSVTRIDIERY